MLMDEDMKAQSRKTLKFRLFTVFFNRQFWRSPRVHSAHILSHRFTVLRKKHVQSIQKSV